MPGNASFQGKKTIIVSQPILLGRQLDGQDPNTSPLNQVRFNSKVVSRQHARITFSEGKFQIQDTKSSSGTFVNGERLSPQGQESRLQEVHDGDVIKLGEDYNQGGSVHLCVMFRIRLPGGKVEEESPEVVEEDYVDLSADNDIRANVDDEFNSIWNSLTADLNSPLKRLKSGALQSVISQSSTHSMSNSMQNSPQTTQTFGRGNDNTVTLIKSSNASTTSTLDPTSPSNTMDASKATAPVDAATAAECVAFIEGLQWESVELRDNLVELAKKHDHQLIAFYKSLKGFPSSFINVAAKYVKYSSKPKK